MSSTMLRRQEVSTTEPVGTLGGLGNIAVPSSSNAVSISTSTSNPWGTGRNIWGSSNLVNTFGPGASRNPTALQVDTASATNAQKTGSGLLVDSSVSDDWSTQLGSDPRDSSRTNAHSRFTDSLSAQRSNFGSSVASAGRQTFNVSGRTPAVNLTHANGNSSGPNYESNFINPPTFGVSEQRPQVYTRHNRPSPTAPAQPNGSESGRRSDAASSQSPADDRLSAAGSGLLSNRSIPGSRNNSLPPSRHSDEAPPTFAHNPYFPRDSYRPGSSASAPRPSSGITASPGVTPEQALQQQLNHLSLNAGISNFTPSASSISVTGSSGNAPRFTDPFYGHRGPTHESRRNNAQLNGTSVAGAAANYSSRQVSSVHAPGMNANLNSYHTGPENGQSDFHYHNTRLNSISAESSGSRRDSAQSRELQLAHGYSPYSTTYAGNMPGQPRFTFQEYQMALLNEARASQLLASQYRNYTACVPNTNGAYPTAFAPYPQTEGNGMVPTIQMPAPSQSENGPHFRSVLLDEYIKSSKANKRYELRDIYGFVVEFSGDQHGSRFIQNKLETANSEEKERIFAEIEPNAIQLMTDVYGNYVIQKFFEHGDQIQKRALAYKMKGQVLNLSQQMYGCRVLQKALEHILTDQQAMLVYELDHNILKCVKDQNGNHVIQKAIERCQPQTVRFILNAFTSQILPLSSHNYGCRVIQRCLEHCEPQEKAAIMLELREGLASLVADQFGNYVVQHVVQHGTEADRAHVLRIVGHGLEAYSKHKFASNVVEKCLQCANDAWRSEVIKILIAGSRRQHESMLLSLIRDSFGNYVIQKLLEVVNPHDYSCLLEHLKPELQLAKRTGCGKQVVSIEKKMQPRRSGYTSSRNTSPLHSRSISARTTPTLTTVGSHSVHTSSQPSINGDAIEGAASSRKNSEITTNTPHSSY